MRVTIGRLYRDQAGAAYVQYLALGTVIALAASLTLRATVETKYVKGIAAMACLVIGGCLEEEGN